MRSHVTASSGSRSAPGHAVSSAASVRPRRRSVCGACGSRDLATFLDLGTSPVADAYTPAPSPAAPRFPLRVAVCDQCSLVQLVDVLPHDAVFGTGYSFYTSASPPLSAYHRGYARGVLARFDLRDKLVVEIGCNDGDLLRHFATVSPHLVGVDPASGPAAAARERGLEVVERPFDRAVASAILSEHGPAALVLLNHVLAHVEDLSEVLSAIDLLLASDGHAVVEVQYLPDLLVNNAFDLVYHEHRTFFSLVTLERALAGHGLHTVDAQLTGRQGGSLRVVAARTAAEASTAPDRIRAAERWLERYSAYDGLQARAERIRERLVGVLHEQRRQGRVVVGYGAPAKATTLFSFCELDQDLIPYVIDTTPSKQGRFIPGTGVVIRSPADISISSVDTFLLCAWNYLSAVLRQHPEYDGQWIIPIPVPNVI